MPQRRRTALAGFLAVILAGLALPASAEGQYFGRNQVKYDSFKFEVLQTEHFDVHYYPRERVSAEAAARMAERWYHRLSTVLRHELNGRQPLVLYATAPEFQQTNVVSGISEGTGGVTEALRRRIVLPIGGTLRDLDHVLGHELVHAFQYDITGGGGPNTYGAMPGATALPLWFIEGMAEYLSLGSNAPLTAMWMRGAMEDTLPSYRNLLDPRFFPYRYGQALLAYVAGRWGDPIMGDLLRAAGRSRNIDLGIQAVLAMSPDQLVSEWHKATYEAYRDDRARHRPGRASRRGPDRAGRRRRRRVQPRALDQSRRRSADVPVEPGPVLHRSLPRRRPHREGRAPAHPDRRRQPPPEPPVHPVGRELAGRRATVRLRGHRRRRSGARALRCRQGEQGA